ncbi:uncharacterized protein LOC142854033 [Microtus pennsylvanicus]|uniref:uncharacterized protein LOC142854033 n=1 Tax=Microtus pennsylvanicus TaxID=10058 RepID=UPI003F6D2AC3
MSFKATEINAKSMPKVRIMTMPDMKMDASSSCTALGKDLSLDACFCLAGTTLWPQTDAGARSSAVRGAREGDTSTTLGRAPCSRGARTRALPRALPRSLSASGGRPLRRAWGARGHRRLRGSSSAEAERTRSREDASVRGASPPSGHQSPDTSEIRLWVCGERNATQTPFSPKPRADKHAQARTQTSPRPALAAARSRRQGRKEPGARRGRRLLLAAPGAAARPHRSQGRRKRPASPARSNGATAGLGPQPRRPGRGGSSRGTQLDPACCNDNLELQFPRSPFLIAGRVDLNRKNGKKGDDKEAGARCGPRHALNSFFIKHQTTKVRMFAELELPYDLIS